MKKLTVISSTMLAMLAVSSMAIPAFAASNPSDDVTGYSVNTGRQSYQIRIAEEHTWYDNEDESVTADYSFNTGTQSAQSRINIFAKIPTDDVTKEDIEAWFEGEGIGSGAAYSNGQYDDSAKGSYGYGKGQAAYQQRHTSFSVNN